MTQTNYLDKIVKYKKEEVGLLLKNLAENKAHPLHEVVKQAKQSAMLFSQALKGQKLSVIAEIKRKSPSKGELGAIIDPVALALQYCRGGASAISVLTDYASFNGTLMDLQQVSQALKQEFPKVPVLRKDFIVHPIQIAEAALAGVASVLLIANILKNHLADYINEAARLGLETLVEIHDAEDLKYALAAKSQIIGINHRNLSTFAIDMDISAILRPQIPAHIIAVAESGIQTAAEAQTMRARGFDAILVGEALVKAQNPAELITQMRAGKDES